jgi:hypothetical protein
VLKTVSIFSFKTQLSPLVEQLYKRGFPLLININGREQLLLSLLLLLLLLLLLPSQGKQPQPSLLDFKRLTSIHRKQLRNSWTKLPKLKEPLRLNF